MQLPTNLILCLLCEWPTQFIFHLGELFLILAEPRLACTPAEANRRKKKLIVPKKLTDVERKNKECELRTEVSCS